MKPRKNTPFNELAARGGGGVAATVSRSDRMPALMGVQGDVDATLDTLVVLIVGVGSVGARVAVHLSRLMVGTLYLVDPGQWKPASLLTSPAMPTDVGKSKVGTIGRRCKTINPRGRVLVHEGTAQSLPLTAYLAADLVVIATDNLPVEIDVGRRCMALGVPLIQGAVYPPALTADAKLFMNSGADDACPACLYGDVEWQAVETETHYRCDDVSTGRPVSYVASQPTRSTSNLCSTAAGMVVSVVLRLALHLGQPLPSSVLTWCGFNHRATTTPIQRNDRCRVQHSRFDRAVAPGALGAMSLRQIGAAAGVVGDAALASAAFQIDQDLHFAATARCPACGLEHKLGRFVEHGAAATEIGRRCPACGRRGLVARSCDIHRPAPAALMSRVIDRPLNRLGAASARWAVVSDADQRQTLLTGRLADQAHTQGELP